MTEVKKDLVPVFGVLCSLVDAKMPGLHNLKARGTVAATEVKGVQDQADGLRRYADRCRSYDPADARESERDAEELEMQIPDLRKAEAVGVEAGKQIQHAAGFYKIYDGVVVEPLRVEYEKLMDKQAILIDKIEACTIHTNYAWRSPELCEVLARDKVKYNEELESVSKEIAEIRQKIRKLERQK